jgi:predicted phage terminase large subunit-like protein
MNLSQTEIMTRAFNRVAKLQAASKAEGSLMDFAEYVWPVCEPAIPFIKGWALEAICEHLEAVTYGQIRRLLINVPPGFTKSLMTDVFWPAWEWGPRNMPHLRYVCASYSNHLTERDNMRCRNVVLSDRYKRFWGDRFKISNEQFTKVKFANDHTGWKLATSVGGIGVGERGDRFIIDDANNTMQMESEAIRDNTNMWFTEVVPDRLNSQQASAIVVIQQRLHEDDVSGTAITRKMGYTHLMIPMEHDVARHCTTSLGWDEKGREIIWDDPRTEEGELAWPERFPAHSVDELRRDKGPYAWAGQYQQSPEPRGGSIIKRDYWGIWNEEKYPGFDFIVASLDPAFTAKEENDPSALTVWGLYRDDSDNPKVMLIWAWQERLEFNQLVQLVTDVCTVDQKPLSHPRFPVNRLLIEGKGSGMSVGQEMYRLFGLSGKFGIDIIDPKIYGDKVARVQSIQHMFSSGMVTAPDRSFSDMVIDQCAVFPKGSHDDLVDSTSQALRWLRDCGFMPNREEQQMDLNQKMEYRPQLQPLYPV